MNYKIYDGIVSSGIVLDYNETMHISSGGVASNTTVNSGGDMYVYDGGVANSTTVNSSGYMSISSGGVANNTTVEDYGDMTIWSGGVASNTTANSSGYMTIWSGGVANDTTVNSRGGIYIGNGGVANDTFVDDGWMEIGSGGSALNVNWTPCVGDVYINDGAVVTFTSKYSGVYFGSDNQLLYQTTVMKGENVSRPNCSMFVMSGGVASNTTVSWYGKMFIWSGGVANDTTVNSGGGVDIASGGVANDTTVNSSGYMGIWSGGVANDTTVNSGGDMIIDNGGVANDTFVDDGWMGIGSGGVASNTTVNSGGYMRICGVPSNTTVNSGGKMTISSGGVHRGKLTINDDGIVSASYGAIIDFTVKDRKPEDDYLINNLSKIIYYDWESPKYKITVAPNQAAGIYKLALGASSFTGSVTVGDGTINYGRVAVNGADLTYGGNIYSLDQAGGDLTLTIYIDTTPPVKPVAKANITVATNKNVTVTASFSSDSAIKQYSLDKKSWKTYTSGIVMKNNGSLYFRGRDKAGNYSAITTYTVKNIDRAAPVISKLTATSKNLVITAKDNVKIAKYVVTVGKKTQTITGNTLALGNLPIGKVAVSVVAYDAAGNKSSAKKINLTIKDTTPPSKVVTLKNPVVTGKYKGTFSWSAAKDNSGKIARYEIQLDNGKIYKSTKTGVSISKLTVGKHTYRVRAIDKNKNVSAWSSRKSFTVKDMTAPSNVAVKVKVSGNNAVLTWKKPKDNVGVTKYILKYGNKTVTLKGSVTKYTITGLNKGNYSYSMVAVDAANNKSKAKTGKITIKQPLAPARAAEALYAADFAAPEALFAPQTDILAYCNDLQGTANLSDSAALTADKKEERSLLAALS